MYQINKNRLLKTFTDLVKIPSPSWKEKDVIDYITGYLNKINIPYKKIECMDSYNLLISIEGDSRIPWILFSAHTDTVIPCENVIPVILDDRITSDGTTILGSDDKSAIAMFLEGIQVMKESKLKHGPVEILLSCAEEVGLKGTKNFNLKSLKSRLAFVFDCSGKIGKIIYKAPYHIDMKLDIKGKAAHSGIEPEKGINAINVLSQIITELPSGRIDNETTMNIGMISGGKATNIVAEEATCMLEIRSISRKKLNNLESLIKEKARTIARSKKAKIKIHSFFEYSGFSINENEHISAIAGKALKNIGIRPHYEISGGGSDTNVFNVSGIKALNFSCGMRKVHTTNEYIQIKDLINGTRLMLSIIDTVYNNQPHNRT